MGMLLAGQTVLKEQLRERAFMFFWLGCFAFTGLAILVALVDAAVLRRRAQEQQRELFQNTLGEIAEQKEPKSQKSSNVPGSSH
jgi:hypothetical protein